MIVEGKVIAISGVGDGLGKTIATVALRDGASVFLGARTQSTLERVAFALDPSGERVGFCRVDINDRERCRAFIAAAVARYGRIDALVNLAALDTAFGGIEDTEPDDWRVGGRRRLALPLRSVGATGQCDQCDQGDPGHQRGGTAIHEASSDGGTTWTTLRL